MRSLLACVAAAAALLAQPAAVQSAPAQPAMTAGQSVAAIDRALTNAAAKGFGGAIIIEQSGKTFLSKGYGFADRERRIPFTPETVAQIGSVTKSQTAAALVTLIAEGKVKLSDPVSKFIPEAPEPGRSPVACRTFLKPFDASALRREARTARACRASARRAR